MEKPLPFKKRMQNSSPSNQGKMLNAKEKLESIPDLVLERLEDWFKSPEYKIDYDSVIKSMSFGLSSNKPANIDLDRKIYSDSYYQINLDESSGKTKITVFPHLQHSCGSSEMSLKDDNVLLIELDLEYIGNDLFIGTYAYGNDGVTARDVFLEEDETWDRAIIQSYLIIEIGDYLINHFEKYFPELENPYIDIKDRVLS